MRILVVGGSGLIGAHVARVLRERGHEVTTVARSGEPRLDLTTATVAEMRSLLAGHDGVVHATRTEEQRALRKPIHPAFHKDLVDPAVRLLTAAREEGLTRGVLMGSYYTYFDRLHPQWRLPDRHTYIRCRLEQAREARAAAGPALPVTVIELPFVFGRAGNRVPNWADPLAAWARSRSPLLAPPGGTAAVAVQSVAEATADALERPDGADIPLADENLTWHEFLTRLAEAVGRPRRIHRLSTAIARAALRAGGRMQALTGRESGINPTHLPDLLLTDLFIEPPSGRPLGTAFRDSFTRVS